MPTNPPKQTPDVLGVRSYSTTQATNPPRRQVTQQSPESSKRNFDNRSDDGLSAQPVTQEFEQKDKRTPVITHGFWRAGIPDFTGDLTRNSVLGFPNNFKNASN